MTGETGTSGALEFVDLARRYGATAALDGLSFSVPAGVIFGFLGPNGAGKTTAMRIVLGIERADRGTVTWRGRAVGPVDRLRFGYMPEQRGLYPKMKVLDQLVYLARLHGVDRDRARRAAEAWLGRLGLADRADERVEKLSHGNQQRVQLIATLVHQPELLILDEPFSGLDPIGTESLTEVLREEAARGTTVVFSSHQLDLVEDICEEVAIIDKGKLAMGGSVGRLKDAATRRLVVEVRGAAGSWYQGLPLAGVAVGDDGRVRIELDGVDPQAVLDRARAAGRVEHFAFERPTLGELFLRAVRR
jgi:ABC-2 type transport system ATP-binding protein